MSGSTAENPSRAVIRPLPTLVIDQIAAGEVVERPASVVKELVENALDAGAGRVLVELEDGGIELIRITDDGCGVPPDELPLAVAPHATSKIRQTEDLDRIATMGFRGEALASIASVSRLTLRSKAGGFDGHEIAVEGGAASPVRPAAGARGTSVEVRTLFFNTPARRKFLRTPATERTRCVETLRDLAMGRPDVAFDVRAGERRLLELPGGQTPRERALALLGTELEPELLEVSADRFDDARGLTLWGLVGRPSIARATNKAQHVLLNGRVIRDKTIQHALREAYRGLMEPGRHPTAVLLIEMTPEAVDVNVHPAKTEVRFRDQSMVHTVVLRAVRDALRSADLTPVFTPRAGRGSGSGQDSGVLPSPQAPAEPLSAGAFAAFFKREIPERAGERLSFEAIREAVGETPEAAAMPETDAQLEAPPTPVEVPADEPHATEAEPSTAAFEAKPAASKLQVHDSYLITQDDDGVVIIDQHALHERVMFEALLARVSDGPLESQRLLTPAVVDATPTQVTALDGLQGLLATIGIDAQAAGPKSVAVHAFPSLLFERRVEPEPFMRDLLERAEADGFAPDGEEALRDVLDMMACKAAVKAGDALSAMEIDALLDLRERVERSSSCPHGRPTSVRLTLRELERLFHRS
ncbi:MAG: DNA mismatch repair endonuclease MutL [Planctomycetota bacterium]